MFNMPLEFSHHGFQDLSYPVWAAFQSGILVTPSLVSAGRAYTSDVFCKPSVARKELALEVTVKNPSKEKVAGQLLCEAVNAKTGAVEKTFAPVAIELAAGEEKVLPLAEKWENPKLWWPDDPNLYRLRATVKNSGAGDRRFRDPIRLPRVGNRWNTLHAQRLCLARVEHGHPRGEQGCLAGQLPQTPPDAGPHVRRPRAETARCWGWRQTKPSIGATATASWSAAAVHWTARPSATSPSKMTRS